MGVVIAWCLALAVPAASEEVLGIPLTAPWTAPSLLRESSAVGADADARKFSETDEKLYWDRLRRDLGSLERWRAGLLGTLSYAGSRPQIFPASRREPAPMFEEYRDAARKSWVRAMDYFLALDAVQGRYTAFREEPNSRRRRAAYAAAYAAYLARARFARAWTQMAARDVGLEKLFDEAIPELGLAAGTYTRIKRRFGGSGLAREAKALAVQYRSLGGGRALRTVLGKHAASFEKRRRQDVRALPKSRARPTGRAAAAVARGGALEALFSTRSFAADAIDVKPALTIRRPLLLPQPDWTTVPVSSRVTYAFDVLRNWFSTGTATGPRPEALITTTQIEEVLDDLLPGDILLVRRDELLSDIGLGGYWHHAGLYLGTAEDRRRYFGEADADDRLARAQYRSGASTTTPRLEARLSAPSIVAAGPRGVRFHDLRHFAAADGLAVLRPRFGRTDKAAALLRAFRHYRKPYDFLFDPRTDDKLASAELVLRAYRLGVDAGLAVPVDEVNGRSSLSSNAIARKFDTEFGTDRQQLDWVLFLDGGGGARSARRATLEEFRRSWRRPKWVLNKESFP